KSRRMGMMIRKTGLVISAIIAWSVLMTGCAAPAPAAPTDEPTAPARHTQAPTPTETLAPGALSQTSSLRFIEHATTDTVRHIGPADQTDSAGDVLVFNNEVFARDNNTKVGTDSGTCVRTAVGDAWECIWTLALKDGSLTVEGPFFDK